MIDFRYHLVSIIAIFMALAVGIVLGSGPLKDPIDETLAQQAEQLRQDKDDLRNQVGALEEQARYQTDVVDALAPTLLADRLTGRGVVVVTVPGADDGLVEAVTANLRQADARVTGTVGVTESWLDPENATELDGLVTRLVPPGTTFPEDADANQRAATVLARSVVTADNAPAQGAAVDADAQAALAGLEELDYVTVDGTPANRATLAVVVAGPAPSAPTDATAAQNAALVELARALDRQDRGTVVAGPIEAAGDGGLVAAVRGSGDARAEVSTVDSAQTSAGRVSVVLGLLAEGSGPARAYGYGPDADGVLPEVAGLTAAGAS